MEKDQKTASSKDKENYQPQPAAKKQQPIKGEENENNRSIKPAKNLEEKQAGKA